MAAMKMTATEALSWLIIDLAGVSRVPAQPWALADALIHVACHARESALLTDEVRQARGQRADRLAQRAVTRLATAGVLSPAGVGWDAGYDVVHQDDHVRRQLEVLPGEDREVVAQAAQRLVAACTIWSKKS